MKKHLVLAGGGHAHLTTLIHAGELVDAGHKVTLVGPGPYHYYSGMGPGVLGGVYTPEETRFPIKKMAEARGVAFVQASCNLLDPKRREILLDSGKTLEYDVLSVNVGSQVPLRGISYAEKNVYPVKPIENLALVRKKVQDLLDRQTPELAVIGGGPAGLEIGGNLQRLCREAGKPASIKVHAGPVFLEGFEEKVRKKALKSLEKRGVQVIQGALVKTVENGRVTLENGREYPADLVILAWGVASQELFGRSDLPVGPDGNLLVNQFLQCPKHPEIFGGGDCIHFADSPLDKVGVFPVRENPILWHNIRASVLGGDLVPFEPGGEYLLILNLGDGRGILRKKGWIFSGKWCFSLKNYIDTRFMKKFLEMAGV